MIDKNSTLSLAESCTGGFLSTFFTSKSGASKYFKGSIVTYTNESKIKLLGIKSDYIDKYGVVSKCIVELMAQNIRKKYNTTYGLATTGYMELSPPFSRREKLRAWVAISSKNYIISDCIFLKKNRLENICDVSYALLNLFRKEIL